MLRTQRLLVCCSLCLFAISASAQNALDALRHTRSTITGTARSTGLGGAFSAVGADISAATLNPAGLGVYRSSNFVASPTLGQFSNQGSFINVDQTDDKLYFGIPSWGYVATNLNYIDDGRTVREVEEGYKSLTFAFGHNQLENYRRNATVQGAFNPISSISNSYAEAAEGFFPDELFGNEGYAFDILVIDTILGGGGTRYFPAASAGQVEQNIQLQESGQRNEWFLGVGANFSDRFYVGGSIGIQRIRYEQDYTFIERDSENLYEFYDPDENNGFPLEIPTNEIRIQDQFSTNGTGINLKAGIIYRFTDAFRVGLSAQTPTVFNLTDEFSTSLVHNLTLDTNIGEEEFSTGTQLSTFAYDLRTPFKVTLGLMHLINKRGFVTFDATYTDFRGGRLSSREDNISSPDFYAFTAENQAITDLLRPVLELRGGLEIRPSDPIRLRIGGAWLGQPTSDELRTYSLGSNPELEEVNQGGRFLFTLGGGLRQPNFYIDVSLVNQFDQDIFTAYEANLYSPAMLSTLRTTTLMSTVGFTF